MPDPLQPISYAPLTLERRPGLVTFIAVVSICVASLSLLFNGLLEMSAVVSLRAAFTPPMLVPNQMMMVPSTAQPTWPISKGHWPALSGGAISGVIRETNTQLYKAGVSPLTDKQTQTFSQMLATPNQPFFDPDLAPNVESATALQIFRAMPGNSGEVKLSARHGDMYDVFRIRIKPDGTLRAWPVPPRPISSVPPPSINMTPPGLAGNHWQVSQVNQVQYASALSGIIVFGAHILLAIILLWAAILLLVSRIKGVRLHWMFVWLKLALVILTANEFAQDYLGLQYGNFPQDSPLAWIGCIYPLALIPLLRFKSVRFGDRDINDPGGFCKFIGSACFAVACLSLLVTGIYENVAFFEMTNSQSELQSQACHVAALIFPLDFFTAMLLIAAGWQLIRLKRSGIALAQFYIFFKLITAILSTVAVSRLLDADEGTLAIRLPAIAMTTVGAVFYPFFLMHFLPKLRLDIKPIPMANSCQTSEFWPISA